MLTGGHLPVLLSQANNRKLWEICLSWGWVRPNIEQRGQRHRDSRWMIILLRERRLKTKSQSLNSQWWMVDGNHRICDWVSWDLSLYLYIQHSTSCRMFLLEMAGLWVTQAVTCEANNEGVFYTSWFRTTINKIYLQLSGIVPELCNSHRVILNPAPGIQSTLPGQVFVNMNTWS